MSEIPLNIEAASGKVLRELHFMVNLTYTINWIIFMGHFVKSQFISLQKNNTFSVRDMDRNSRRRIMVKVL